MGWQLVVVTLVLYKARGPAHHTGLWGSLLWVLLEPAISAFTRWCVLLRTHLYIATRVPLMVHHSKIPAEETHGTQFLGQELCPLPLLELQDVAGSMAPRGLSYLSLSPLSC